MEFKATIEAKKLKHAIAVLRRINDVERGIHQHTLPLRPIGELRKPHEIPELPHTATIIMSGKEFKEIIAEAGAAGEALRVTVRSEGVVFDAEKLMDDVPYRGKLDAGRFEMRMGVHGVQAVYSIDYLQDIATDMRVADEILLKFTTDMPCEIMYTRDGVEVRHILAPRIESD